MAKQFHVSVSALEKANSTIKPLDVYSGLLIHLPARSQQNTNNGKIKRENGLQMSYSKEISCVATAYTASRAENPWGAVDYFGNPLKLGTVAVDPSVIPLGSTLYITGCHFDGLPAGGMIYHATDEGGAIKGNRVDMFVPTSRAAADKFGMQDVKVYVLKK